MSKIYLLVPQSKTVNWDNTKRIIANNLYSFALDSRDYGIGEEASVECPGCGRTLPIAVCSLDHIRPQSRYTPSSLGVRGDDRFVLFDHTMEKAVNMKAVAIGGTVHVGSRSPYVNDSKIMHSAVVWQNDLRNLQFVCSSCNSSKGAQTWMEWGRNERDAKPISKILRQIERMWMDEDD